MSRFDQLSLVVAGVTALFNLAAVFFVGWQVRQAAQQARSAANAQQHEWEVQRKRATVEFITSTMEVNQQLVANAPFLERDPVRAKTLMEHAERDPDSDAKIRAYLDYLEDIAVGVNEGILDLGVVNRMSGGRFIAVAENCAPYIRRRRDEIKSETLYCELIQMAEDLRSYRETLGYAIPPSRAEIGISVG